MRLERPLIRSAFEEKRRKSARKAPSRLQRQNGAPLSLHSRAQQFPKVFMFLFLYVLISLYVYYFHDDFSFILSFSLLCLWASVNCRSRCRSWQSRCLSRKCRCRKMTMQENADAGINRCQKMQKLRRKIEVADRALLCLQF